jgi:hypothetical protein
MSKPKGRGKLIISFELLASLLHLPEDAQVYGIAMSPNDLAKEVFEVYVKHDDLPECPEGGEVFRVIPKYEYEKEEMYAKIMFAGWGEEA